jgi:alanyl-tRNA synthetase
MVLLACQKDAYQKSLETELLSLESHETGLRAYLKDTILYPEGGGQPADCGQINGVEVKDVQRDEAGQPYHVLSGTLTQGPVNVVLDWERRFDHMQQHTAQHLITALALHHLEIPTVGFHIGPEDTTLDLGTAHLATAQLEQLEGWVNKAIGNNHAVCQRVVSKEEITALGVRSRRLPSGHSGEIRVIEIESLDLNTCGGTHVASTGELQMVKFLGTEKMRGNVRLHYVAGHRVRSGFQRLLNNKSALTHLLSAGADEHASLVEKLLKESRKASREQRKMREALAESIADSILKEGDSACHWHWEYGGNKMLQTVAKVLDQRGDDKLVLLTSGDEKGGGFFLLRGLKEQVTALGPEVARLLSGRGGGSNGRYQGRAEIIDNEAANKAIRKILNS